MSEIPEDVWQAADTEARKIVHFPIGHDVVLAIARAIMAERLRCADVVLNAKALNADERYFISQIARKIVNQPSSAASS